MNGDGGIGRQDNVGGGEVGVRELNVVVVNRMSRRGKGNVNSSHYRCENVTLLSSLMSRCTNPIPCIHPTALHNSHHILFNTDSPTQGGKRRSFQQESKEGNYT